VTILQPLCDLGTKDTLSFSLAGRVRTFYVLNIPNSNIRQFQEHVRALPGTPEAPPPQFSSLPQSVTNMFEGGKGGGKGQFDSPTAMAVDPRGNIFVTDTGNGRIEKFSPTGTFLTSIGQVDAPNGIAIDREGNIYVAEIGSKHRLQKLAPDGAFIAEWKGPEPGFYGPRRIAVGPDNSIYVVDSGRN